MKITLISFTKKGACICKKLTDFLGEMGHKAIGYSKYVRDDLLLFEENVNDFTRKAFVSSNAMIFVGATGIAVRAIAPLLKSKAKDPAVIVINETGEYVIPILSGHVGGANKLSESIANFLGAKAVITTATDINNIFSVDMWATENALYIDNTGNIKHISAALLNERKIGFFCDFPINGELPDFLTFEKADFGICIYNSLSGYLDKPPFLETLFLQPRQFVVGVGCRKGIDADVLEEVFLDALKIKKIPQYLVSIIATIDIKKKEEAIIRLYEKYEYELKTFSSKELLKVKGEFSSSKFVRSVTGVDNICERAALLACNQGNLILRKTSKSGITIAIAVKNWRCSF